MKQKKAATLLSLLLTLLQLGRHVEGHGRLIDPPSRSSVWRQKRTNPLIRDSPLAGKIVRNSNDHQLFCGGVPTQKANGGRCGVCGDNFADPSPRANEAGGKYGLGIISRVYKPGQEIIVRVQITAQHKGYFEFRLCVWNNPTEVVTQECLNMHLLDTDRGTRYEPITQSKTYNVKVKLPEDVTCSQCVLQWKYNAGNSWGCEGVPRRCALGLGPQEQFYGCADIAIRNDENEEFTSAPPTSPTTTTKKISSELPISTPGEEWEPPATRTTSTAYQWEPPNLMENQPDRPEEEPEMSCKGKTVNTYYKWDCVSYYICMIGYDDPINFDCPPGTVYDGSICNHPYNVAPPCGTSVNEEASPLTEDLDLETVQNSDKSEWKKYLAILWQREVADEP